MDDTLWKNPEKKFKPRNKQAALICIKAKPFFQPPVEEPKPVMAETFQDRLKREEKERQARIAVIRAEQAERKRKKEKRLKNKVRKPPKMKNLWFVRLQRKLAKQRGEPPPHPTELSKLRKKLPGTGTPLYSTP